MPVPTLRRLIATFAVPAAILLSAVALLGAVPQSAGAATVPFDQSKSDCFYSDLHVSILQQADSLLGANFNCVMVFNDVATNWATWELPWFITNPDADTNWAKWQHADPSQRRLIITQSLIPQSENNSNWRQLGASGAYTAHARAFAQNLVNAGLGNAVIRLAHEANGTWYADNIGSTTQDYARWRQFWRNTVIAMRAVPGAHFEFDFCVNATYRQIPLDLYYPGDDVVNIVGIDAYDVNVPPSVPVTDRWQTIYNRPYSIKDLLNFAHAHQKPLSIPEWGLGPTGDSWQSGGDDPGFVNGLASVVANNEVAYQSYFYAHEWATQLTNSPLSITAYGRDFVLGGQPPASSPTRTATAAARKSPRSSHAPRRHGQRRRRRHRAATAWRVNRAA